MQVVHHFQRISQAVHQTAARFVQDLLADTEGVTAIEYALIAALIAVAILVALSATGGNLDVMYERWTNAVIQAIS